VFEDETMCPTHQLHWSNEDVVPYAEEPPADPAWRAVYEKETKEEKELEKELKDRLTGREKHSLRGHPFSAISLK